MNMLGIPGVKRWTRPLPGNRAAVSGLPAQDRIKSVWDEGILAQARAQAHKVAFFAIDGTIAPGIRVEAIAAIAEAAFGVEKGSARVCVETASLSLAFDPNRTAFVAIQRILDRKLARLRLTLLPMTILQ
jgi:hypothetical protein